LEKLDTVVAGAGVIGLAIARSLARSGRNVVVLEAADAAGNGVTSRSSEVIHAGIYYQAGSLKARCCRAGREALYAYCKERGVETRRTGKLIVATTATENATLRKLQSTARTNGVTDLQWLDSAAVAELAPEVRASAALWSPSTGIVDSRGLVLALQAELDQLGGTLVCQSPLFSGQAAADGLLLEVGGISAGQYRCRTLVIAAGLQSVDLARRLGLPGSRLPPAAYAKGHYFTLSGDHGFNQLVYPVPGDTGLGVHLTLDLQGQVRFGPDVCWVDQPDYGFDADAENRFREAISRYYPAIADRTLLPAYVGVRPRCYRRDETRRDFRIDGPDETGIAGLHCLYGIESPGLTSALAIGELVAARIAQRGNGTPA
jgi:L-2-hydroxyglutarate oxidase LhgO